MFGGLSDSGTMWPQQRVMTQDAASNSVVRRRRCALCGRVTPTTAWVRGNYWHWGYPACDACLDDRERANLLASAGCAVLSLLPVAVLAFTVLWAVVSAAISGAFGH